MLLIVGVVWVFGKGFRFSTYADKDSGYSIKYPSDWALEQQAGGTSVIFLSSQENDLDIFRENVSVVVQDISAHPMDLQKYSELAVSQMELVFKENLVILESAPARFAQRQGYKFEFLGKGPETELHYLIYWTISGVTAYQVTYTALSSQFDRYLFKVKRMFSSFRIQSG